MTFPDKHQLKFNSHKDAKILMEAIEKRFGGNTETKKAQKTLLKQQYENFIVIYSFFASQSTKPQLDNEDLKQIDSYQVEEEPVNFALMGFLSSSSSFDMRNINAPKPNLVFNIAPTTVETDHSAFTVQLSPTKPEQDLSHTNRPTTPIIGTGSLILRMNLRPWPYTSPKSVSSSKKRNRKACFVCKSMDHLIKDYDDHAKKMAQPTTRNHAHRGTHKQYAPLTHTNLQKHKVPTTMLTQSKPVSITAVRPVSAVVPKIKGNPQHALKDKEVIDSGCSRHMTGNMSYLSNFEELNGGY
nr:ribonuclease H-like domain-containing protein [Tanacetum cinerariifolium]